MADRREGLLAEIEAGVHDDKVSLASLLQKCISLGRRSGSEELREWARQELHGYDVKNPTRTGSADRLPNFSLSSFTRCS